MKCSAVQERLVEYLLDELLDIEKNLVSQHLSHGCVACNSQLANLQASVEDVYACLPQETQDVASAAETHAHVIARIAMASCTTTVDAAVAIQPAVELAWPRRSLIYSTAFAAGVLLAIFLTWQPLQTSARAELESANQPDAPPTSQALPPLASSEGESESFIVLTSLTDRRIEALPVTQVLYDRHSREIHFFGQNFLLPRSGEEYVLTSLTQDGEIEILQRLRPAADGRCKAVVLGVSEWQARHVAMMMLPVEQ